MNNVKAVIADVDGTLLDTLEVVRRGQYEVILKHLKEIGIIDEYLPTYAEFLPALQQVIGGPVRTCLEETAKILFKNRPEILGQMDFDRMVGLLIDIQNQLASKYAHSFTGLPELLASIGKHGQKFGIFTSGGQNHLVRNFGAALPQLNIVDLYKDETKDYNQKIELLAKTLKEEYAIGEIEIVTADDVVNHKPHAEPVTCLLEKLKLTAYEVVALGDHTVDMQSAKNAGVENRIGITHGSEDEMTLVKAGATHIVHSLHEIPEYIYGE